MPIDIDKALGASLEPMTSSWDEDAVILYHLGLGAGSHPTDPGELEYTYEANLKVLPSFVTTTSFAMMAQLASVEGLDFSFAMLLHGEQAIEIHRPVPTSLSGAVHSGRISEIYDKGKGALVILEIETTTPDGERLFTNRSSIFLRGEGGFGGDSGPAAGNVAPERTPDHVIESPTLPQQALLYRLSGDKNPLHADPAFAAFGGFDRPILHGLCSYGVVCKAVVDTVLSGDTTKVSSYSARFAGPVFPGETIVTSIWEEDGGVLITAETKERNSPVISNAALTVA